MVRITGLVAGAGAGFGAGTGAGFGEGAVAAGFRLLTERGFIALKMLDWLDSAGLPTADKGAIGFCTGWACVFGRTDGVLFAISSLALAALVMVSDFIAVTGLAVFATALVFFGTVGTVVLATKYSCALKTFKQEPQRTAPLADCNWLGVTRKAVPHLGQRVIIWLLAEVMVYLPLAHERAVQPGLHYYRDLTV